MFEAGRALTGARTVDSSGDPDERAHPVVNRASNSKNRSARAVEARVLAFGWALRNESQEQGGKEWLPDSLSRISSVPTSDAGYGLVDALSQRDPLNPQGWFERDADPDVAFHHGVSSYDQPLFHTAWTPYNHEPPPQLSSALRRRRSLQNRWTTVHRNGAR